MPTGTETGTPGGVGRSSKGGGRSSWGGVSYFAKSNDDHRNSRSLGWTCFWFWISTKWNHTLFISVFGFCSFTSRHITPLQLVLSHLLIFYLWSFGFSVILSVPKTCARLCSYQRVGVDCTGRGRMGLCSAAEIHRFDPAPLKQRTKFLFIH